MENRLTHGDAGCDLFTADSLSMEIIVPCPQCHYELHLPTKELLGRRGKCPQCQHKFELREKPAATKPVSKPAAKPEVTKPLPKPEAVKPAKPPKPAPPPKKPRIGTMPVPIPGDEDFKNLEDPDFGQDDSGLIDPDDPSDSAPIPAGIWDDLETDEPGRKPPGTGSSFHSSGVFDVLARCPHCHVGIDFKRDVELQDYGCPRCRNRFSLIHPETPPQALAMPQQVGTYILQKYPRIGIGPFGTVYRAKDGQTQEPVAIKVSRGGLVTVPERERFLAKLKLIMQLKQPSIATVHEVGSVEDRVYIVSSYVGGVDLSEYLLGLPERTLSMREVAMLCAHIAGKLHHAHRFGVIHGNLKPTNIRLMPDQNPCLFDFSLNDREFGLQMTENGRIVGTAAYLAPEQLPGQRREPDAQTDVYALGAILYELLTGQRPFAGEGEELLRQIAKGSPVPPRAIRPEIPKPLETICLKCLETHPKSRYQSAQDVAKELRLFWEDKPIQTPPPSVLTQFGRWCRRRWILAGMLFTFLILATLGACYMGLRLWLS
jgi:hypothetical protein